jgi:hypothetical protein
VILFSAFLVVVAVGLLIVGVVTSKLMLVYIAIGVSGVALLALVAGALVKRRELFGEPEAAESEVSQPQPMTVPASAVVSEPATVSQPAAYSEPPFSPQPTAVRAGSGWPAPGTPAPPAAQAGPSRAGYLPTQQQSPDVFTPRSSASAEPSSQVWEWRDDAPSAPPPAVTPRPAAAAAAALASAAAPAPAQDQPSAKDEPPAKTQPPADAQPPAADQPPADQDDQAPEDQKTTGSEQPTVDRPAEEPAAPDPAPAATGAAAPVVAAAPTLDEPTSANPTSTHPAPAEAGLQREVTVVPGVPRYHNARCILIRFMGEKDLDQMTVAAARQAGCTPCRACLPDQPEKTAK